MTPPLRSVLAALLCRVVKRGGQLDAVFLFDEARLWPKGAIEALIKARLLREATPTDSVTCLGCEERCLRPVALSISENKRAQRALWNCHLHADLGPFDEPIDVLRRWCSSREMFARFVGKAVGIGIVDNDANWRRCRYGTLRMNGKSRAFSIEFDGSALVRLGSASIPLIELLEWGDAIAVDRSTIATCFDASDDTQSGSKRVQASTTVRGDTKLSTQLRYRRLQQRIETLARQHPKLNKEQLAHKLVKSGQGEGMSTGRIARVTRMPKKSGRKNFA